MNKIIRNDINWFLLFLKIYDSEYKVVLCIGKEQHDATILEVSNNNNNNNIAVHKDAKLFVCINIM